MEIVTVYEKNASNYGINVKFCEESIFLIFDSYQYHLQMKKKYIGSRTSLLKPLLIRCYVADIPLSVQFIFVSFIC